MKSSRRAAPELRSIPVLDGRIMTAIIPVKWRGVVLLSGTIIFFPIIVGFMMLSAVLHDLPRPAVILNSFRVATIGRISTWWNLPRRAEESRGLAQSA